MAIRQQVQVILILGRVNLLVSMQILVLCESIAIRSFSTALSVGDQFSFDLGVNYNDGNKGFNLRTAGDSIFNFNVGSGASVSSDNATIIPGAGLG